MAYDSLQTSFLGKGVIASRPASPNPAPGVFEFYYATDTTTLYLWNGSSWVSAGGGGLSPIANLDLLANISGSSANPSGTTVTALLDAVFGTTQGSVLYRGASAWAVLAPGTSGDVLTTGGSGANPAWAAAGGGGSTGTPLYVLHAGVPALGSFTQVGITGTTSIASGTGFISVTDTGANVLNLRGIYTPVPGTTPYRVAMFVQSTSPVVAFNQVAFGWTDGTKFATSSSSSASTIGLTFDTWTNATTRASSTVILSGPVLQTASGFWLGLRDDGTSIYYEFSMDGVNFLTYDSGTKASGFLGATGYANIFLGVVPDSAKPQILTLRCYDTGGLSRSFPTIV